MALLEGQIENWKAKQAAEWLTKLAPICKEMEEAGFTEAQIKAIAKLASFYATETARNTAPFGGLGIF